MWLTIFPQLVLDDFIEISNNSKKMGEVIKNISLNTGINQWIEDYSLIDQGAVGLKFT